MPILEKKTGSLRYVLRILVYALNITLLILGLSLAESMRELTDPQAMGKYIMLVTDQRFMTSGDATQGQIASVVMIMCLGAFVCLLLTLRRLWSAELSARSSNERLMFALGYRKRDIVSYETAYVMIDLGLAYVVALIFSVVLNTVMEKVSYLSALRTAIERDFCLNWEAFLLTAAVVVCMTVVSTAMQVRVQTR